jgi:hypothetical protein
MTSIRKTSLTSPSDMKSAVPFSVEDKTVTMSSVDVSNAYNDLTEKDFIHKYPSVERYSSDPPIRGQKYFVISFCPSSTAIPDKDGVYGMAKVRCVFDELDECNEVVTSLIQNVDSYAKYQYGFVGKPFPITQSSQFSKERKAVDIKKKAIEVISNDVKKKKDEEQQRIKDIKKREENLFEEIKKETEDPTEVYTTLRTKRANMLYTILETEKKIHDIKKKLKKTEKEIRLMEEEDENYKKVYLTRYQEAREKAGIKPDANGNDLVRFMGDDMKIDLDGISDEE